MLTPRVRVEQRSGYELHLNLKTAKALDLTSDSRCSLADGVIERSFAAPAHDSLWHLFPGRGPARARQLLRVHLPRAYTAPSR